MSNNTNALPVEGEYAVLPSDPTTILAGIRQFGLAPDGSDLRDLATAIEAAETRVRELEARNGHLINLGNEYFARAEAAESALATERERADKLVEALTADGNPPEIYTLPEWCADRLAHVLAGRGNARRLPAKQRELSPLAQGTWLCRRGR